MFIVGPWSATPPGSAAEDEQPSPSQSTTSSLVAFASRSSVFASAANSDQINANIYKRMVKKGKKGTTENNQPTVEDLGKIFDEMVQERLGQRDPISRRWQRKAWALSIWAMNPEHFNMQGSCSKFVIHIYIDSSDTDAHPGADTYSQESPTWTI
ncbi:hypothetical protein FVER14953_21749 [Fusarium verticillioides]|nr:hypothetical protein FVER14953_21749 [Fusarium verticillioides]